MAERGKDSEANPGQEAEFEQAPGIGDDQGSLVCCSPMRSQRVGHD